MARRYDVAIFDGNNLTRRAQYAHADLSIRAAGREPMLTGVCFGVMKAIEKMNQMATRCEIVWDAGRTYRLKLDPTYKGNRPDRSDDESEQEYLKQLKLTRKMISALGVAQIHAKGEEADDVVATLARKYEAEGLRVLVVSTDQDYYQLVTRKIHILSSKNSVDTFITKKWLMEKYGLKPRQFLDVLSLCGDRGDNVRGVAGIGEKSAIEIVKAKDGLVRSIISGKGPTLGSLAFKVPKRILTLILKAFEHRDTVKLARNLTRLRSKLTHVVIDVGQKDTTRLRQYFKMLGFASLLAPDAWKIITKEESDLVGSSAPTAKEKARAKLAVLKSRPKAPGTARMVKRAA